MTTAAIYARVSSARQAKDETIGSQLAAVTSHAEQQGLDVPPGWVFTDDGHSGASLVRPGLERLRDLIAQVPVEVVVCYSPDRLARKFAYQALLIEEFTRAGTRVEFVKGPRGDSPEDQLLVQFQGMFAEYEKAQILERSRRGKAHRAKAGSVNVLGGAPFGFRYVRKTPDSGAIYEICEHEAVLVAEMFRRYTDEAASIADLARWLTEQNVPTRTGKHRWDRSVIWAMLRNPAYAGTAMFGKTLSVEQPAGINRAARLAGRSTPTAHKTIDRPREEWTAIAVPAIITEQTFARAEQRLADNKRFAARNTKIPSLLQGLTACAGCGYAYYRTSTRTTNKKIFYYRCLGSDDYRYPGGRVCSNTPVRADYLDQVVWDHITALIADPALIAAEIDKRLHAARTADPATTEHRRLDAALTKTTATIARMITAFSEQLITIDELRTRMPDLRARETNLRNQIQAIDAQTADRGAYLKLAQDLGGFLNQLRHATDTAAVPERQRILRLLVKDILVGPENITIRHHIPIRERTHQPSDTDTEGDPTPDCPLRWRRDRRALRAATIPADQGAIGSLHGCGQPPLHVQQHPRQVGVVSHRPEYEIMIKIVEKPLNVQIDHPVGVPTPFPAYPDRIQRAATRPIPIRIGVEDPLHARLQVHGHDRLRDSVRDSRHPEDPDPISIGLRYFHHPHRWRKVTPGRHPIPQFKQVPLQVLFELLDRYPVHSRRTLVGLHPSISLEDRLLGNTERLRSAHLVPPGSTG
jgi:site-specific DNA recombinase